MKKAQSIRQKITLPFLIIAIILPLATLLVFNISMRLYLLQAARTDLKTTAAVMETLIRQQALVDQATDSSGTLNATIKERLTNLRTAMRATRLTATTDLLVLDKDGQVLLPADPTSLGLNAAIIQRIATRLNIEAKASTTTTRVNTATATTGTSLSASSAKVQSIWTRQGHFLFIGSALFPKLPNRTPTVVYLTRVSLTSGFMLFINLLLIGIFLVGSIISVLITRQTASSIEQPLQALNQFADRIGHGDFTPTASQATCQELTELSELMNNMAGRLNHADTLQKTFLQNASHEIRTPLMAIQGYAEGLISGIISDTPRAASIIRDESLRLKTLVEELLTLSRIENRSGQLTLTRQNLTDNIRETVARFQAAAIKDNKNIQMMLDPDPLPAQLDEDLLNQAVANLLTNAIRYASREIVVRVFGDQKKVVVRIEDDGPGIPENDLPHLFERFYKGTDGQFGLGLSIACSAVTTLHGTLTASNRTPAPGAAFEIRLPKAV